MQFMPSEVYFAKHFAMGIKGSINGGFFLDKRNSQRTEERIIEDNINGKLGEIFIYNILGVNNVTGIMDFDLYDGRVGDRFDIITTADVKIDVKVSSPRAKCIMVEVGKYANWERTEFPDYLCMVSMSKNDDKYTPNYMFGIDFESFKQRCTLYSRGDNIPNTNFPLKADNYIITIDQCETDPKHLIRYCKGRDG